MPPTPVNPPPPNTTEGGLKCEDGICTFVKPDYVANYEEYVDVVVAGEVAIARGADHPIFNAYHPDDLIMLNNGQMGPPSDTLWAFLPFGVSELDEEICGASFCAFGGDCFAPSGQRRNLVNRPAVLRVTMGGSDEPDLFFNIMFTSWSSGRAGGFSYLRDEAGQEIECPGPLNCRDGECIFVKPDSVPNWEDYVDVLVPGQVGIARGTDHPLFNPFAPDDEQQVQWGNVGPPTATAWLFLPFGQDLGENVCNLEFCAFTDECYAPRNRRPDTVGRRSVLRVDQGRGEEPRYLYYNLCFDSWQQHRGGGFSYTRDENGTDLDCPGPLVCGGNGTCDFTKPDNAVSFEDYVDDIVPGRIGITRGQNRPLFNPYEPDDERNAGSIGPPTGTKWAFLPQGQEMNDTICDLGFCPFTGNCFAPSNQRKELVGKNAVLRIDPEDDEKETLFYRVNFTSWSRQGSGGFAYTRDEDATTIECPGPLRCEDGQCTFTKPSGVPDYEKVVDVLVPGRIGITRGQHGPLFNPFVPSDENAAYQRQPGPPSGTKWVFLRDGQTLSDDFCSLEFCAFTEDCFTPDHERKAIVGRDAVLRVDLPDVSSRFYNIRFTSWDQGYGGGGFSYIRDETGETLSYDCPDCNAAESNPSELGPPDDSLVNVSLSVPLTSGANATASVQYVAVSLNESVCEGSPDLQQLAVLDRASNTLQLRRSRWDALTLRPLIYYVHFQASTEDGSCFGTKEVCVPPVPGFGCHGEFDDVLWDAAHPPSECSS